ncbi:MAG: hypothetical protein FGM14_06335 [Flavobacteriales bacterium]|nr:hypothetical protein [Flavobacteriales bacterium]
MYEDFKSGLSKTLFWDVNIQDIDAEIHSLFIVERVLTRGTLDDFRAIKNYYGIEKLKSIIVKIKNLDERTLSFCSVYFSIPKSEFRCYNFKQSNQTHWNY